MEHNNTKETQNLIDIFMEDNYTIDEDGLKNSLQKITQYYKRNGRHQYHVISQRVSEMLREGEEAVYYLLDNIHEMSTYIKYKQDECEEVIKTASEGKMTVQDILLRLAKLYDHIALEEERIKTNNRMIRKSQIEIENNVIGTFNSITDDFQNKVDEISNSLNANIITVVGLFSAIIFVFFGGVNSISAIVSGIWAIKAKEELNIPLIVVLVVGLVIFNVVFLLLYCIAKIVDKNIGSSVSYSTQRWYHVEEISDGCYGVFWGDEMHGKCYRDRRKAEKKANTKNHLSEIKASFQQLLKKIFLRFPYVVIINIAFIGAILYFYVTI